MSPSDDELKIALIDIKTANPTLGISKVHALLQSKYPDWTVSEKRTRKILQSEGLIVQPESAKAIYPSSRVIPNFDVKKWSSKVEVKYLNKKRGKGLVATEQINEGETVWKEDPFIVAPEWEIYDLQLSSKACGHCTTSLTESSLVTGCPASSSAAFCPFRFCNRLCLSRSAKIHPLLCRAQNPACAPLLNWAREVQWMALHAIAQCTSRLLLAFQSDEAAFEEDWQFFKSLAVLGMEERFKNTSSSGSSASDSDKAPWKKAHTLFLQVFKPQTPSDQKKLAKVLKKPLTPELDREIFDYDAFSRGLGRMSLNLEAHGGLYILHSHLNHSCAPNTSIRHFDRRTAFSRITVVTKRDIQPGEELLISYVNPESGLKWRRRELDAWGFGNCDCPRCLEEEKENKDEDVDAGVSVEMKDLESELKAGLGVL